MKVINGEFGNKKSEATVLEQITSALEDLGVGQETEVAFLVAVETPMGLHTAANERIGDTLLTLEMVKQSLVKTYVEHKGGE